MWIPALTNRLHTALDREHIQTPANVRAATQKLQDRADTSGDQQRLDARRHPIIDPQGKRQGNVLVYIVSSFYTSGQQSLPGQIAERKSTTSEELRTWLDNFLHTCLETSWLDQRRYPTAGIKTLCYCGHYRLSSDLCYFKLSESERAAPDWLSPLDCWLPCPPSAQGPTLLTGIGSNGKPQRDINILISQVCLKKLEKYHCGQSRNTEELLLTCFLCYKD